MSGIIPDGCYGEEYTDEIAFVIKPNKVLGEVKSKHQTSTFIETEKFGRIVFQDGLIYLADRGNDAVMEMHVHIPLLSGKPKKKVLLIGAGDGGGLERYIKYPDLEKIVGLDVDEDFVKLARKVMPDHTASFNDPRVELRYEDGSDYIRNTEEVFDAIAVTVGDPYTISKTLFNSDFVENAYKHISDDGVLSMDGYMPYYTHDDSLNYWDIFKLLSDVFPIVRMASSTSPLMPGGLITFIYASKTLDVSQKPNREAPYKTGWYTPQLHTGSFALPQFVREKMVGVKGFVQ